MNTPNSPYPYSQYPVPQHSAARTAINDLESFMSGLTDEDRGMLFTSPEFAGIYGDLTTRFMFYLLQSPIGAEYINSSSLRREKAERLRIVAHNTYAANKKFAMSEIERLQEENRKLKELVVNKEIGDGAE